MTRLFISLLECRSSCVESLGDFRSDRAEDFLGTFFHYLQFGYHNCECEVWWCDGVRVMVWLCDSVIVWCDDMVGRVCISYGVLSLFSSSKSLCRGNTIISHAGTSGTPQWDCQEKCSLLSSTRGRDQERLCATRSKKQLFNHCMLLES